jgi:vanillate monooxygenase ferredoxin subunit
MHEELALGAALLTSPPRNHFQLVDGAPTLLLAGGIGITPLVAMVEQLRRQERGYEHNYCSRSRQRAAFVERLSRAGQAGNVHFQIDDECDSQKLDLPAILANASSVHHLYVCGPAGFIQHVTDTAAAANWAAHKLHREFFAAPAQRPKAAVDTAFEIVLSGSGRRLTVLAGRSALSVFQEAGVEVSSSCEAKPASAGPA